MIRKWSGNDLKMIRKWADHDPKMIRKWSENERTKIIYSRINIYPGSKWANRQADGETFYRWNFNVDWAVLFNYFHVPSIIEWPTEFLWYSTTVFWYRMYDVYKNVVQKYLLCSSLHGTTTYTVYSISIAPSFTTVREG